ncbi:MAG: hypothetical protein ACMV1B_02750 [Prevotella sp.]
MLLHKIKVDDKMSATIYERAKWVVVDVLNDRIVVDYHQLDDLINLLQDVSEKIEKGMK